MPQLRHGVVGVLATIRGDRHCAAGRVVQVYLRRGSVHHVVPDPSHLAHGAREVGRKQLLAAPLLADVPQGASCQHLLCHNMQHSTAVRAFVCLCLCG